MSLLSNNKKNGKKGNKSNVSNVPGAKFTARPNNANAKKTPIKTGGSRGS